MSGNRKLDGWDATLEIELLRDELREANHAIQYWQSMCCEKQVERLLREMIAVKSLNSPNSKSQKNSLVKKNENLQEQVDKLIATNKMLKEQMASLQKKMNSLR